jgi:nucleotide-binding universal stress UspA family protein
MNTLEELIIALQAGVPGQLRVTLLGVSELSRSRRLEEQMTAAREALEADGLSAQINWQTGSVDEALLNFLPAYPEALTLFSGIHRRISGRYIRLWNFRRLLALIDSPLMRVRSSCSLPKNALVCSGGLPYSIRLEKLAIRLAQANSAKITFFHVVEPVTHDYPLAREVLNHWETLLNSNTPQALHFQGALDAAAQAGVEARIVVRHGALIHELFEEIRSGSYDLVAVGSSYSSQNLRHLTRPDVAPLVASSFDCPVLTARGKINDTYG